MNLPKELTTVTPLSKVVAGTLFLILPFAGFFLGIEYQKSLRVISSPPYKDRLQITISPPYISSEGFIIYTNDYMHYSFQHTASEKVLPLLEFEGPLEESPYISIIDANDSNTSLVTIQEQLPTVLKDFKNEREAMTEIVSYYASSTSQYASPENNMVTGPVLMTMKGVSENEPPLPVYRYEIAWRNNLDGGDAGSGKEVWLFIPIAQGGRSAGTGAIMPYAFLWLRYDKANENRIAPILDSFTLSR